MTAGWRIGREEIIAFMSKQFKVYSWQTVRRWRRRGMPIHKLWTNDRPYIIEAEVIQWQIKRKTAS